MGFSLVNHPFGGTLILMETPMCLFHILNGISCNSASFSPIPGRSGLLIDGSEGGLPVVRRWTVSSAVHLSALEKLQKDRF